MLAGGGFAGSPVKTINLVAVEASRAKRGEEASTVGDRRQAVWRPFKLCRRE